MTNVIFKKKKPYGKLLLKTINGLFFDMLAENIDNYLGYI